MPSLCVDKRNSSCSSKEVGENFFGESEAADVLLMETAVESAEILLQEAMEEPKERCMYFEETQIVEAIATLTNFR